VLLHAAGLWQPGIPGQITGEDIDFLVDTNVKATIFTNQAAYAVMRKGGGGRIINFGSGEAVMGSPISALYAATKGAVAERSATRCATSGRCCLASEGSRFINGQLIAVDGGLVMLGA
jgi:NAD(P)-dependent dehydrogenase (short-subunit alcohol dehydrogenase family)